MPVVLAMDIATRMGWALHKPGMERPFFGTVQFVKTPEKVGEAMEQMRQFLERQHDLHDLEAIEKALDRDTYMTAEEARNFGLVDEVFSRRPGADADKK